MHFDRAFVEQYPRSRKPRTIAIDGTAKQKNRSCEEEGAAYVNIQAWKEFCGWYMPPESVCKGKRKKLVDA